MSDIVKWGLLVTGAVIVIGLIVAMPLTEYIDIPVFTSAITVIVNICGDGFRFARGAINNLLSPWARSAVTGLAVYIIGKRFLTLSLKIIIWIYHFIFK